MVKVKEDSEDSDKPSREIREKVKTLMRDEEQIII